MATPSPSSLPERYTTRVVLRDLAVPRLVWYVEQVRLCDCPDCDRGEHWMVDSIHETEVEAKARQEQMWQPGA